MTEKKKKKQKYLIQKQPLYLVQILWPYLIIKPVLRENSFNVPPHPPTNVDHSKF